MASKVCTKCNVLKRIEEYTIDRSKPMGYKSSCKECFLTARRLTPEKNRKWALNLQQISRDPYVNFYTLFYSRIYEIVKWQVTDNVAEHLVTRVTDG